MIDVPQRGEKFEWSPSDLQSLLHYEPETGELTWKPRPREMFAGDNTFRAFHTRYAGKPAGSATPGDYVRVGLFGRIYLAHRLAWAIHHGVHPRDCIDHINGDFRDNRLVNLRDVPAALNVLNARRRSDNISGVTGVSARNGKFVVRVTRGGASQHATCATLADAVHERKRIARALGFHPNHGRKGGARLGKVGGCVHTHSDIAAEQHNHD